MQTDAFNFIFIFIIIIIFLIKGGSFFPGSEKETVADVWSRLRAGWTPDPDVVSKQDLDTFKKEDSLCCASLRPLHPVYKWISTNLMLGFNPAVDKLPIQEE